MPLYKRETKARILHRELCSSPNCRFPHKQIRPGMQLVTLTDFDPRTKKPGGTWKRHAKCPPLPMEASRLLEHERRG